MKVTLMTLLYQFYVTVVRSKIPFCKNLYHIETSQLICCANQLSSFYVTQIFTEGYFLTNYKKKLM